MHRVLSTHPKQIVAIKRVLKNKLYIVIVCNCSDQNLCTFETYVPLNEIKHLFLADSIPTKGRHEHCTICLTSLYGWISLFGQRVYLRN